MGRLAEWVIVADRESGLTIVHGGFTTARDAAAVRTELERHLPEDDTTNFLLLTRVQAQELLKEEG